MKAAFFGGIYNNHLALAAAIDDARREGVDAWWCLGDVGGFGPYPNRSIEMLRQNQIPTVQGNYDYSVGNQKPDCGCGYTDPRDNHFARLSYAYTLENTAAAHRPWLAQLPPLISTDFGGLRLAMVHGSPRQVNEFLWASTSPDHLLEQLAAGLNADVLLCTHTGLHWQRTLASGRTIVNVGALGRPANDGNTHVWYALLDTERQPAFRFIPVIYDYRQLADQMGNEKLPAEFIETIETGWWTTCLELLPAKERLKGRF